MNDKIRNIFGLVLLLFAVLVVATSWWTVDELGATGLRDNPHNRRQLLEQMQHPRGLITAADGTVLASNKRSGSGETKRYYRTYPQGGLFAHAVGYYFVSKGSAGLEKEYDDQLAGRENEFVSTIDQLLGHRQEGEDVRTTLDPQGQRTAIQGLAGRRGAVVAMEPSTGRVRVMVSEPGYDPNRITAQGGIGAAASTLNRTTQARYPPGSTFKVVTASAAIDSGRYNPNSVISGKSPKIISGVPLNNFGGENFGAISLTDALTHSVNTVFGEIGEKLGRSTLYKYMLRFGFQRKPPMDYPRDEMIASGAFPAKACGSGIDFGRVAIGQECHLFATPLQMAEVAATVANKGVRMKPQLVERVVAKDGRVKQHFRPKKAADVMSAKSAAEVGQMMQHVVEEGTGTAARLQGISVAGKTGTAEIPGTSENQVWFIGYAPADNPRMVVAVTIERTQGEGGTVAAPVAKQVLQTLLGKAAKNG
ncbi:MAG TPA: penicillin-binding protein 2 [Thermoleophilaceae bacterium]|nr:penicillin-binding protein 2 [Thermoleophilaceae bacterium]